MMPAAEAGTEQARKLADDLSLERLANLLRPLASPLRLQLLRFLTTPHYLEEIASHLKLTRQAARKHLDQLVEIDVLERRSGTRERGPVTEYVTNPQALFLVHDEFERMGSLQRQETDELLHRTMAAPARAPESPTNLGASATIVRGLDVGRRIPLSRTEGKRWVIGRDAQSGLVIAYDPYVSNKHAEVVWERGQFILLDLGSTNGTSHNWKLLPRRGSVVLSHGDIVGVGKTLLVFWNQSA